MLTKTLREQHWQILSQVHMYIYLVIYELYIYTYELYFSLQIISNYLFKLLVGFVITLVVQNQIEHLELDQQKLAFHDIFSDFQGRMSVKKILVLCFWQQVKLDFLISIFMFLESFQMLTSTRYHQKHCHSSTSFSPFYLFFSLLNVYFVYECTLVDCKKSCS